MTIEDLLREPASLDDVINTLQELRADLLREPEAWENPTLEGYLEAMEAWLTACKDRIPPEATWRVFVGALTAAKLYE
jgi:hypothetical protein